MENKKLSWEEISKKYDQEWVLLDAFDWPEEAEYPTAGVVQIHCRDRNEFDGLMATRPSGFNSAIVFVGIPQTRSNSVTSRAYSRVEFGS